MKTKCCGVHHEKMHSSKWNIIYVYIVITLLLIDVLACMIGYYGLMVVTSIPNKNEITIRYSQATGVCLGVPSQSYRGKPKICAVKMLSGRRPHVTPPFYLLLKKRVVGHFGDGHAFTIHVGALVRRERVGRALRALFIYRRLLFNGILREHLFGDVLAGHRRPAARTTGHLLGRCGLLGGRGLLGGGFQLNLLFGALLGFIQSVAVEYVVQRRKSSVALQLLSFLLYIAQTLIEFSYGEFAGHFI